MELAESIPRDFNQTREVRMKFNYDIAAGGAVNTTLDPIEINVPEDSYLISVDLATVWERTTDGEINGNVAVLLTQDTQVTQFHDESDLNICRVGAANDTPFSSVTMKDVHGAYLKFKRGEVLRAIVRLTFRNTSGATTMGMVGAIGLRLRVKG